MKQNLQARTFGCSPAAIRLAELINEKNHNPRKIARTLEAFNRLLSELTKVDSKIGFGIAHTMYLNYCNYCNTLPVPFDTYTRNVLSTNYKVWQVKNKTQVPYKTRKKNGGW